MRFLVFNLLMVLLLSSCGKESVVYITNNADKLNDLEKRISLLESATTNIENTLNIKLADLGDVINNIKTDITNIYGDINDLEQDLDEALDDIEELQDLVVNANSCLLEYRDLHTTGPNIFADIYIVCDNGKEAKIQNNIKLQ